MGGQNFRPPQPISAQDETGEFDCGHADLDAWLRQTALASEGRSARTYVVTAGLRVVAYSCLAAGAVIRSSLPRAKLRLAVDRRYQGLGLGKGMLKDAIRRSVNAAELVGVRAIVVHAIDDAAAEFYKRYGFTASPLDERTLLLPVDTAVTAL